MKVYCTHREKGKKKGLLADQKKLKKIENNQNMFLEKRNLIFFQGSKCFEEVFVTESLANLKL